MLTLFEVKQVMELVKDSTRHADAKPEIKQAANSLRVYLQRGEYDTGWMESAVICLELAGYEISRSRK